MIFVENAASGHRTYFHHPRWAGYIQRELAVNRFRMRVLLACVSQPSSFGAIILKVRLIRAPELRANHADLDLAVAGEAFLQSVF